MLKGAISAFTDTARECAQDRQPHVGRVDKARDEAIGFRWRVVDMKGDWNAMVPLEKQWRGTSARKT